MEIRGKRQKNGDFMIEVGPTIFNLPENVVKALADLLKNRSARSAEQDKVRMEKRLDAYRGLAQKLSALDDALVQSVLGQITPDKMVTLARLAPGDAVYNKILKNLSRQNGRQFADDYKRTDRISVHQASTQMEQMIPVLRRAIQARKQDK